MGLFSSIGKVFKSVAKPVANFVGGATGIGPVFSSSGKFNAPSAAQLGSSAANIGSALLPYYSSAKAYDTSLTGGREARDAAIIAAKTQMDFQERMATTAFDRSKELATDQYGRAKYLSDTSYQRGMSDMRKAGLNPILAYKQGGASTPGIGLPSTHSPTGALAQIADYMTPAVGSAASMRTATASANAAVAQYVNTMEDVNRIVADTGLKKAQEYQIGPQVAKTVAEIAQVGANVEALGTQAALNRASKIVKDLEGTLKNLEVYSLRNMGRKVNEKLYNYINRLITKSNVDTKDWNKLNIQNMGP